MLIYASGLVMDYPRPEGILRLYNGLSFGVEKAEFVAVLGGSGWGKSTLVNIMLGIEHPSRGSVHYNGKDVTGYAFVKRSSNVRVSAVFQRPTSLPQLTVAQNIALALSMARIPKRERDERLEEALTFFGLDSLAHSYPDQLSAGQRRRVDLARALAVRPELLVLDEPTGDLDTSTSNLVLPLLKGLNRDYGTSIMMTTAIPRIAATARRQIHLSPPVTVRTEPRIVRPIGA